MALTSQLEGTLGSPSSHISLLQEIARPLLSGSAPPVKDWVLTQAVLEESFLPFAATVETRDKKKLLINNARLSLCLEGMMRLLRREVGLSGDGGTLRMAVEKGIKVRREVVDGAWEKLNGSARAEEDVESARTWFDTTEGWLKLLLMMVERGR